MVEVGVIVVDFYMISMDGDVFYQFVCKIIVEEGQVIDLYEVVFYLCFWVVVGRQIGYQVQVNVFGQFYVDVQVGCCEVEIRFKVVKFIVKLIVVVYIYEGVVVVECLELLSEVIVQVDFYVFEIKIIFFEVFEFIYIFLIVRVKVVNFGLLSYQ